MFTPRPLETSSLLNSPYLYATFPWTGLSAPAQEPFKAMVEPDSLCSSLWPLVLSVGDDRCTLAPSFTVLCLHSVCVGVEGLEPALIPLPWLGLPPLSGEMRGRREHLPKAIQPLPFSNEDWVQGGCLSNVPQRAGPRPQAPHSRLSAPLRATCWRTSSSARQAQGGSWASSELLTPDR